LATLVRSEPTFLYKDRYMDLLSDIIKELLRENKSNKLQTFGYTMEEARDGQGDVKMTAGKADQ
jgi:hypothetical protein